MRRLTMLALILLACSAPQVVSPTPDTAGTAQAQVRATVSAAAPTATVVRARPTVSPTWTPVPTVRPSPTSVPVVITGLNRLLVPIDGELFSTNPEISNDYSSFATYKPDTQAPDTKMETLVVLEAIPDEQAASRNIREQRDSAYPSQAGLTLIRGVTLQHGWTNDRQPPSYLLTWVDEGSPVITVSLDSSADHADRAAVEREGKRVADALVGHLSR